MWKLKLLLILLSIIFSIPGKPQTEIANIDFPYKTLKSFKFSQNQNGDYCLFANRDGFYYFCYISNEGEKIYDTTIFELMSVEPIFLGVKPSVNRFIYYFLPAYSQRKLRTITISKHKDQCTTKTDLDFFDSKKEKIVRGISKGSDYFLITATKKNASIFVTQFMDESGFLKKEFKLKADTVQNIAFSEYTRAVVSKLISRKFPKAGYENFNSYYIPHNERLFMDDNIFHFYFKEGDVLSINLENETLSYKFFNADLPNKLSDFNSFIHDNILYQIIVPGGSLILKIYNLEHGHFIKEFRYDLENEFILTPDMPKKYRITPYGYELVEDTITVKKIFQKSSKGIATIYGFNNNDDEIHLFLGSNLNVDAPYYPISFPGEIPVIINLPPGTSTFNNPFGSFVSIETILSLPEYELSYEFDYEQVHSNGDCIVWPTVEEIKSFNGEMKLSETENFIYVLQIFKNKKELRITRFEK